MYEWFLLLAFGAVVSKPHLGPSKDIVPMIVMERSGCEGICPAYTLMIFEDGTICFEGSTDVLFANDTETAQMSVDSVNRLVQEAREIGFADFPSDGVTLEDAPVTTISIRFQGEPHKASADFLSPNRLLELADHIDRATHSIRWIGIGVDREMHRFDIQSTHFHSYKPHRKSPLERAYDSHRHRTRLLRQRQSYYRLLTDTQLDSLARLTSE